MTWFSCADGFGDGCARDQGGIWAAGAAVAVAATAGASASGGSGGAEAGRCGPTGGDAVAEGRGNGAGCPSSAQQQNAEDCRCCPAFLHPQTFVDAYVLHPVPVR